jgi:hypothetical protein
MSDSTIVAPGFLRRGPASHDEPERRRRIVTPWRRPEREAGDPNTASPQRLTAGQAAELDALERQQLPARVQAPPPPADPLSPEIAALVPQAMVEKAKAFREATLASYQNRIDNTRTKFAAALARDEKAYAEADRVTAAMVEVALKMAVDTARHVASINDMEADLAAASDGSLASLRAVAEKHVPNAVTRPANTDPAGDALREHGVPAEAIKPLDKLHEAAEALGPQE